MTPTSSPRTRTGFTSIEERQPKGRATRVRDHGYTVTEESPDDISALWVDQGTGLKWNCPFILPLWLKAWLGAFGTGWTQHIRAVRHGQALLGIAPLMVREETAHLIGDPDVCDCLDFVLVPGREPEFFEALLDHLRRQGITRLDLRAQRPGLAVHRHLLPLIEREGYAFSWRQEDVTYEVDLPATWEEFLDQLTGKQRHEVRRKMRRVDEAGHVHVRNAHEGGSIEADLEIFFDLFRRSREDKAAFLTAQRQAFFREMTAALSEARLLRLYVCEMDGEPAAAVMCFDYGSTRYLYNNGYDPRFRSLSVGIVSKLLTIKDSIEEGRRRYDFLRGDESYKRHLGGKPVPLYALTVDLC